MMFSDPTKKALSEKLDASHVKKPSGSNGPKGDYIEGWHAIAEANRIFGFDGWSYRIVEISQCGEPTTNQNGNHVVAFIARVEVTTGGVVREDIGYGSGFSKNIGDAYESATKEAVTDALKRALRTFGNPFGLALYDKSQANVETAGEKAARENGAAIESLWAEINSISSTRGLELFWKDNVKIITGFDQTNRERFTAKKDELKRLFSASRETVDDIQDTFPGSSIVDERMHPLNAG